MDIEEILEGLPFYPRIAKIHDKRVWWDRPFRIMGLPDSFSNWAGY
jgi:hypothetical protein